MKKALFQNGIYSILSFLFLWILWIIAYYSIGNDYLFPNFVSVFSVLGETLTQTTFYIALGYTILRAVLSFFISLFCAILFVGLSTLFPPFRKIFMPVISIARTLPTMAILLLILLWSTPSTAPIWISALVLFPMLYSLFYSALENIDKNLIELSEIYHVPLWKKIKNLYFPNILAFSFSQLGTTFSFSLKLVVSAEVLSHTYQSIGGMMQTAQIYLQIPTLMALTLCIIILGLVIEGIFLIGNRFICRWRYL